MNLRFPGQYYDQETGTHYNFHRDYKPNAGRYVQSDPIGLEGGVNSYNYTYQNPLTYLGTDGWVAIPAVCVANPAACAAAAATGIIIVYDGCKAVVQIVADNVDDWWNDDSDKRRENDEYH